jgi:hypothetical protein
MQPRETSSIELWTRRPQAQRHKTGIGAGKEIGIEIQIDTGADVGIGKTTSKGTGPQTQLHEQLYTPVQAQA